MITISDQLWANIRTKSKEVENFKKKLYDSKRKTIFDYVSLKDVLFEAVLQHDFVQS